VLPHCGCCFRAPCPTHRRRCCCCCAGFYVPVIGPRKQAPCAAGDSGSCACHSVYSPDDDGELQLLIPMISFFVADHPEKKLMLGTCGGRHGIRCTAQCKHCDGNNTTKQVRGCVLPRLFSTPRHDVSLLQCELLSSAVRAALLERFKGARADRMKTVADAACRAAGFEPGLEVAFETTAAQRLMGGVSIFVATPEDSLHVYVCAHALDCCGGA
jgi:hypothetical protein